MIGSICGCLGCHAEATTEIAHEDRGRMVVCEDHADGHEEVVA